MRTLTRALLRAALLLSIWSAMPAHAQDGLPQLGAPATLAASGAGASWTSGLVPYAGGRSIAVAVTLNQTGSLSVQRFLDAAGVVPQGPAISQALTANVPGVINLLDNRPWRTFSVTVTNTGGAVATVFAPAPVVQ